MDVALSNKVSQEKTSGFNGQMNESLPLHSTQNTTKHFLSQIESSPKAKRDITGTLGSKLLLHIHTFAIG